MKWDYRLLGEGTLEIIRRDVDRAPDKRERAVCLELLDHIDAISDQLNELKAQNELLRAEYVELLGESVAATT